MVNGVVLAQYIVDERRKDAEARAKLYQQELVRSGQIKITERRGIVSRIVSAVQGAKTSSGTGRMATDHGCQPA
jgi:hypothetical protein